MRFNGINPQKSPLNWRAFLRPNGYQAAKGSVG
jgi:hypothetical protein